MRLALRFDMRAPPFGTDRTRLYREMLQMVAWADQCGFTHVRISEHHGVPDGYLPAPLIVAAAIAARTERLRIGIAALVLTLHDPIAVAEQVAVLDHLSNGRIELTVAAGYVPSELKMFGVDPKQRGALMEEKIRVLRYAWSGEEFEYRGRRVRVTPPPLQRPYPPLYLGGSTPAAARRAARLGIGLDTHLADLYALYADEARKAGFEPAPAMKFGPGFLHVSEDPEADWARIAPHALYETNAYGRWAIEAGLDSSYKPVESAADLRRQGSYAVLTPAECIALAATLGDAGTLLFHPLMGGLDPEFSWKSLRLFEDAVLPHIGLQ
jgi:alkanesulfonate monooxygenase SsuD/methylene tetrahydromethanopterin reductase-like flavin-dependent oxidoreductase (luciferase family)